MTDQIQLGRVQGAPVYVIQSQSPEYGRLYGAKRIDDMWVSPAWHPFSQMVEHDLSVLDEVQFEWTPDAKAWAEKQATYPERIKNKYLHPDFKFVTKPYDHQIEAVSFGVHMLRSGLFLDLGTGKTKCAIDIIWHTRLVEGKCKALVVVPNVILLKWADEIALHSGGDLTSVIIKGTPKQKKKLLATPADVHIITYGSATKMMDEILEKLPYTCIVFDESHALMSPGSQRTKACVSLATKAARRIIMTGTASLGDPRHLWGQFQAIAPFMQEKSAWAFAGKYCIFEDPQRHRVIGYQHLDIVADRMKVVGITKLRSECVELPARTFVAIPYDLEGPAKNYYNELVGMRFDEAALKLKVPVEVAPATRLGKVMQVCGGWVAHSNRDVNICTGCKSLESCVVGGVKPYTKECSVAQEVPEPTIEDFPGNNKLTAFGELLDTIIEDPAHKLIVWAHYHKDLDNLVEEVSKRGVSYVRVDGSLSATEMQANVKQFQRDPDTRVYIGQTSTGVGIDLVQAQFTVFYGLSWDLGAYLQALDRNHRIGTKHAVTVYSLLGRGTIEECVWEALQNKMDIRKALTMKDESSQTAFEKKITRPEPIR